MSTKGLHRLVRPLLATFFITLIALAGTPAKNPGFVDALWVAESGQVLKIARADGTVLFEIRSAGELTSLAIDARHATLWAYGHRTLYAYDFAGDRRLAALLPSAGDEDGNTEVGLAVDPKDGSVWLGRHKHLYHLDGQGQVRTTALLDKPIRGLSVDPSRGHVWVATRKHLSAYNALGQRVQHPTPAGSRHLSDIAYDPSLDALWVADHRGRIRRYGAEDGALQLEAKVAKHLETLAPDHNNGLWVSADEELIKLDLEGREVLRLEPFSGEENKLIALVADPVAGGVWVAAKRAIRYVEADGQARPSLALTQKRKIRALALYTDSLPPRLSFSSPAGGSYLPINQPIFELHHQDSAIGVDTATLAITEQGQPLSVNCTYEADRANCTPTAPLAEGTHSLQAGIADFNGNRSDLASVAFTVDTVPPAAPDPTQIHVTDPEAGTVAVTGAAGSVEPNAVLMITNTRSGESVTVTANSDGSFTAQIAAQAGDALEIRLLDAAGNQSETRSLTVGGSSGGLPPDPATVAPPLTETGITPMQEATAFLYSGADPIQTGVAAGTIDPLRVAVIRGKVLSRDNQLLSGVTITIKDHSEFGQTLSRTDGEFDMAVNGGGLLTVNYEKPGYLPAQRQVQTPWQDYALVDDVVMVVLDQQVTTIDLSSNAPIQVAQGSVTTDQDGTRQATVFFPAGTGATMTLADGTTQSLTTLEVRATEYTVGENGPQAMPGPLPTHSGYTYAVELSVDAALAAGSMRVDFDQALPLYVDNFLNFPIGGIVPVGWYDKAKSAWIPSDNGRVIKILSTTGGTASLDTDGDDLADDSATLTALGITDAELAQLAGLYPAGKTLWRAPITHFTPWDCNWPYGPPLDSEPPPPPDDSQDPPPDEDSDECPGCSINAQARTLGEALPITGTPYVLHYQSRRAKGYQADRELRIPLAGAGIPASLQGIDLSVTVAGQSFTQAFPAAANQSYSFVWDGLDGYGRPVTGNASATVTVSYRYNAVYYAAPADFEQSFAQASAGAGTAVIGTRGASTIAVTRTWQKDLAGSPAAQAVGDWSLSTQHRYDAVHRLLELGTGEHREAGDVSAVITTVAGTGTSGFSGDGGPATQARLSFPQDVAVAADGSLYIADDANQRVRMVGPEGIITTVAGNGTALSGGDGGPATQANLNLPRGVAVAADGDLYIADYRNQRVRMVGPEGIITTVAGNGTSGFSGDGGPATLGSLMYPTDVAVAGDGSLYIADYFNQRIRRVGPDGVISTVTGTGQSGYGGDGGPATQAKLYYPHGLALGPDGSVYIADLENHRIRRVWPDGIISTVAGSGITGFSGDGGPATQARLSRPWGVAVAADGSLYIADEQNHRIRRVGPALPGLSLSETLIPSADGVELYHFDAQGRHLRTLSALTGAERYRFAYDAAGQLHEITDGDGDVTRIERDSEGQPTAIVAPDGQRTTLTLDANGYLASVTNPAGEAHRIAYTANGLMTQFTDPKGNINRFEYDSVGRLLKDTNAGLGGWTIAHTENATGYTNAMTTAEGRTTTFKVEPLSTGDRQQINTYPGGTVQTKLFKTNGEETTTAPDGTVTSVLEGPDPRFGMQAPVPAAITVKLPSGLTSNTTTVRTAALSVPTDPPASRALGRRPPSTTRPIPRPSTKPPAPIPTRARLGGC